MVILVENKTLYRVLLVTVLMLLLSIGIYIGLEISDYGEKPKENIIVSNTENVEIDRDEDVDIYEEEQETDVHVKYSDYYPDCGHTIEQEEYYQNTTKEKVKKDIEKKDITYKFVGERDGFLIYQKVHTGICMNHYKVILEDEIVRIYRTNEIGEYSKYQDTEITSSMLREGIEKQLREGIYVDDIEELYLLMEDIES